ncbi:MAG TPA: aminodeoxychorismate synthase component I [Gammaproteobacteria bacterium]|nr:aminodeoxychorismate synthase component I [Gammaproteobacteria bacterium]
MQQQAIAADFDLLDLHASDPGRYPHLLESAARGPAGRFDILFAFPGEVLELRQLEGGDDFLERLDDHWRREYRASPGPLPFQGGWFLYLGYELAGQIEPCLRLPAAAGGLPVASATRFPAAIVHDHQRGRRWLVAERSQQLQAMLEDIERLSPPVPPPSNTGLELEEEDPERYLEACGRILRYIEEGDVFQVNLSRGWQGVWPSELETHALYRRLRLANPGPFNALVSWGDRALLCSSPERLVEVRGEEVQTRPIAGTRPRSPRRGADRAYSQELLRHPKERAEHVMLIDLERNDLGRIAVPGSVEVSELMTLESYATVHHIVSNVRARRRPGVTPGQVIRAVFPGGTITGCPKVRCMEIIAELEGVGRGAYTGAIGYLNRDDSMDLNILIRTLVRDRDRITFRTGAGIVADSLPERELEETRAKARGLLRALQGESS